MAKEIDSNVNTTTSVFKDTKKTDAELSVKQLNESKRLVKNKRVKFECDVALNALYPNGFVTTFQGIPVYLIFDGRTVELPEAIVNFVKEKIKAKAASEAEKRKRVAEQPLDYLGKY